MNIAIFLLQIILQLIALRAVLRLGQVALAVFVALEALLANLFVLKQIPLFGLTVTASDSFIIGSLLGLSLYQERFGKKESDKLAYITFGTLFFMTLASLLHLWLAPSHSDASQSHYHYILGQTPRLAVSSLISFFISTKIDVALFSILKEKFTSITFFQRALITILISQAIDTCSFSFLALWGIVDHLSHIILFSFLIKALCLITYLICQPHLLKKKTA